MLRKIFSACSGCVLVLLFAAVPSGRLFAQSATGSISGNVVDASGGGVPGASVSARNVDTAATRATTSGVTGAFTFPYLTPGNYLVSAELSGFSPAKVANVTVTVGGDATVRIVLEPAGVQASVTVSSEAPLIETTKSQVSSVVNERLIQALPTNGRNFLDIVLSTPGVVKDNFRVGDLVFAGQRGTLNSLVVDGADNNNTFFGQALGRTGSGRAPYQFSLDSVKEFQVNSNAYSAEYGRAGGAVINVVTKSGTNEFHGNGFYFYRDKTLNAKNFFDAVNGRPKSPYHFDQFGATLGGPIVPDKLFFFANYDGQRNKTPNTVILTIPSGTPSDPDTIAGISKLTALAFDWNQQQNQDAYLLKMDYEISSGQHATLRYNRQNFTGVGFESSGSTVAFEHSGDSLVNTDTVAGSLTSSITPALFNELRGQWAKDGEPGTANSSKPEARINQGGPVLTIGENFFSPRETTIKRWQVADAATYLFGAHTVKGGFDYQHDNIFNYFPGNFFGSYLFQSIASFNRGAPNNAAAGENYIQAFPGAGTTGPITNPNLRDISGFVQDEWRILPSLTLNAGLRYDLQKIQQPSVLNTDPQLLAAGLLTNQIPEDHSNWGPRVGIAWTPRGSDRTLIHAGYGIFYGRTTAIMIGTAHSNNGINVQTLTFTGASVPTYPDIFTSIPPGGTSPPPTIFVFDPKFQNPMVHQASAGVEQVLTNDMAVAVNYLFVMGNDLPRSIDINIGTPSNVVVPIQGDGSATVKRYGNDRPFSKFGRVIEFQSTADSRYNGLTVELTKRFSRNWQARLAYTLSKVTDNKPDATAVVVGGDDGKYASDPQDFGADDAPGDNDVRHRIVLSGVWNMDLGGGTQSPVVRFFASGWTLSGVVSFQTGQPYSLTINGDLNNDGNNRNDRVPGTSRNSRRLPSLFSVDPRLSRHIPLGPVDVELIAEAFNVFNAKNVIGLQSIQYRLTGGQLVPNTAFLTPCTTGQGCTAAIAASTGPRIVQLAAKVSF